MADAPSNAITSAFPAPPPFYKSFTTENVARLNDLRDRDPDLKDLPTELQNLLPPPAPTTPYRSFGELHEPIPYTSSSSNPQPLTAHALTSHLQTRTQQLLLHFLAFITALSTDPVGYGPIWDQLRTTFEEIHTALNGYRPHVARESLIGMMEEEVRKGKEGIRVSREGVGKMREVLEKLAEAGGGTGSEGTVDRAGIGEDGGESEWQKEKIKEKRIWEVVWREVGKLENGGATAS